jgi:hypothetical protein
MPKTTAVPASILTPAPLPARLWAIQQKRDTAKGGPDFWVVNPETWPYHTSVSSLAALAISENDARAVTGALNKNHSFHWAVVRQMPEYTKIDDPLHVVLNENSSSIPLANVVAWTASESCANAIASAMEATASAKPEDGKKMCCSCGPKEDCNRCTTSPRQVVDAHIIKDNLKRLEGRILRVIDAAITNEKQHGAMSALVRKEMRDTITNLGKIAFGVTETPEAYAFDGAADHESTA